MLSVMRTWKNIKLGPKLVVNSLILVMLAGIVGALGLWSFSQMNAARVNGNNAETVAANMLLMRQAEKDFMLSGEQKYVSDARMIADDTEALVARMLASSDASTGPIVAKLEHAVESYRTAFDAMVADGLDRQRHGDTLAQASLGVLGSKDQRNASYGGAALLSAMEDERSAAAKTSAIVLMLGIIGFAAVLGTTLSLVLAKQLTGPLSKVARAAESVSQGDVNITLDIHSVDEIGKLADAMRNAAEYMQDMGNAAATIASGDLRVEVKPKSEKDVLGNAFVAMVDSLNQMGVAAGAVASGDLTVDVRPKSDKDVLGNAFSRMSLNLRNLVGKLNQNAASLAEASRQLSAAASQAGSVTQGIAAASEQVARGAEQQSHNIQDTTSAVQELSKAIEQIARGSQEQAATIRQASEIVNQVSTATAEMAQNTQTAADGARKANEAAAAGTGVMSQTVEGMNKIKAAVDTASTRVAQLGERSKEIGKIVAVIDDIAAQTNLLALNAAIEAARAGEQGRGFAVVADEVRKLAERVSQATKEIASLIETVQQGVSESMRAADEGTKEVAGGLKLADEAGKALKQIMESVSWVAQQIEQISAASEEVSASADEMVKTVDTVNSVAESNSAAAEQMAANSDQVTRSVGSIGGIAEQNSAASQQVSASAQQMSAQVQQVVASSQSFAQMSEELRKAVAAFKLSAGASSA